MSSELAADTTLSHYRIVSKLGAGGMGEVYLGAGHVGMPRLRSAFRGSCAAGGAVK